MASTDASGAEYLKHHKVNEVLATLVAKLVDEKPADPLFALAELLVAHNKNGAAASGDGVSYAVLAKQDDVTSTAVVKFLTGNDGFVALSKKEGDLIVQRDKEDDAKLAVGIDIAVKKGVLPEKPDVSEVKKINVVGKTADAVAEELQGHLGDKKEGLVLVIQGLSGTGKGTTTAKIQAALPSCVTWSNGNVFRTLTMLASDYAEEKKIDFGADCLTAELLEGFVARLSFDKFDDGFDVVIDGKTRVSTIQNTTLKEPRISSRVPTVAEQTQGEVVKFAAGAVKTLQEAGKNVILEGRAQTLNHIPTPFRFELVIEDVSLLGQRRAAQRVMAAALKEVKDSSDAAAVGEALKSAAAEQAK